MQFNQYKHAERHRFVLQPKYPQNQGSISQPKVEDETVDNDKTYPLDWDMLSFMQLVKITPKCEEESFTLILITSAPQNQDQRKSIRETWCSKTKLIHPKVPLSNRKAWQCVFLIGRHGDATVNANTLQESQYYSDILLGDYVDSYRNLSFKVLTGFHWASMTCHHQYILKTDDDCFVNVRLLPEFLSHQNVPFEKLYAGNTADQDKKSQVRN